MKTIVNAKEIKEAIKLLKSEKVIVNAKNNKTKLIMNEITKNNYRNCEVCEHLLL